MKDGAKRSARAKPRQVRRASESYLERAALYYLDRYASSAANLERILMNKVRRSARIHGTDPEEGAQAVKALIGRLSELGILDDAAYAEGRARALRRRGVSERGLRRRLAEKGIAADLAERAIAKSDAGKSEPDLAAALAFARRRRLGPFRAANERKERRSRDLAALSRQGFDYETARRVIDAKDIEELEAEAALGGEA